LTTAQSLSRLNLSSLRLSFANSRALCYSLILPSLASHTPFYQSDHNQKACQRRPLCTSTIHDLPVAVAQYRMPPPPPQQYNSHGQQPGPSSSTDAAAAVVTAPAASQPSAPTSRVDNVGIPAMTSDGVVLVDDPLSRSVYLSYYSSLSFSLIVCLPLYPCHRQHRHHHHCRRRTPHRPPAAACLSNLWLKNTQSFLPPCGLYCRINTILHARQTCR
jgi:hypothetical protein